jgi:hypothetical protein
MALPIRKARAADGALTYALPLAPGALPPVTPRALLAAWDTAREAVRAAEARRHRQDPIWPDIHFPRWAPPRLLHFRPEGGEPCDLAIQDPDAGAWAEAIDSAYGLESLHGMALCLRLLALVEALTRLPWLAPLFRVTPQGVALDSALLHAAATLPLDAAARFDDDGLRRVLARPLPNAPNRAAPGEEIPG